ncbi:MAG TPA: hypothetical protein VMV49_04060, partial [Candidatus Deferrimicrobium sp.]|nr:hypothetical protein [Candidatus Deferrimicrobium sp.]
MKIKPKKGFIFFLFLLFATMSLLSPVYQEEYNEDLTDPNSILHIKTVSINGNSQLNATASSGNGTAENPYILEGYVNQMIGISNTNAYFILRNCTISHIVGVPYDNFKFTNVTNAKIVNNTYSYCYCGSGYRIFQFINSHNNIFANNTMTYNSGMADNFRGFCMDGSDGNQIINNDFCYNWQEGGGDCFILYIVSSDFNNFSQNKICYNLGVNAVSRAVWVSTSNNNTITQNWICNNYNNYPDYPIPSCGIQISGADNNVTWNIIHNNTIQAAIGAGNTVE